MTTQIAVYVFDQTETEFADPICEETIEMGGALGNKVVTWRLRTQKPPVDAKLITVFDNTEIDSIENELIATFANHFPKVPKYKFDLRLRMLVRHNRLTIKQGKPFTHSQSYDAVLAVKTRQLAAKLQKQL